MSASSFKRLLQEAHRAYTGRPPLPPIAGGADPVKVGSTTTPINGTSGTVTKPAGLTDGDVLIINYGGSGKPNPAGPASGSSDAQMTPPTGFSSFHFWCGSGNNWCSWAMWRVVDGTEGSTFTASTVGAVNGAMVCMAVRGLDPTTPIISNGLDESDSSVTSSVAGTSTEGWDAAVGMIFQTFNDGTAGQSLSYPAGFDESTQGAHEISADNTMSVHIACDFVTQNVAGVGSQNVTKSLSAFTIGNVYALKVAGAARAPNAVLQIEANGDVFCDFPSAVEEGNTVIVGQMTFAGSTGTVPPTDTKGNTYTLIPGSHAEGVGGAYYTVVEFYQTTVAVGKGGSGFTVNNGLTAGFVRTFIVETVGVVDVAAATYGTDSGGTHGNDAGTLTLSQANEIVVMMNAANGVNGWTPDAGWIFPMQNNAGSGGTSFGYTTVAAPGAYDAGITASNTGQPYSASAVSIKSPTTTIDGSVEFDAASTFAATGRVRSRAAATLSSTSTLTETAQRRARAVANLSSSSALALTARAHKRAIVNLNGVATFTTIARARKRAVATFNAHSTLIATGLVLPPSQPSENQLELELAGKTAMSLTTDARTGMNLNIKAGD